MPQLIVPSLTTFFGGIGLGATAAGIAANLTASLIFSAASRAIAGGGRGSQPDLVRALQLPTSLPPKRFAYDEARIYGSWAPGWVVKAGILYGCLIFNSRPSDGSNARIFLDKREVTISGDLFDFATGASATNSPFSGHAKFWMGRGDQVSPPAQIMAEVGDVTGVDAEKFWSTDGWRGLTVLWVRLDRGKNSSRAERWPRTPPEVEMQARWSKVWDPRDVAQDTDDPATWVWSNNQGLCLLDAVRTNPLRQRDLRQIDLDAFVYAADVADEAVPVNPVGTEPRYRAGGLLIWSAGELIDQLAPLVAAGGGDLFQAGGRLGYAPAVYRAPFMTISDGLTGQPFKFTRAVSGRDLPRAIRAQFVDPNAEWEMSQLLPFPVPGAGGYDGGDDGVEDLDLSMVNWSRQAMRLQKIMSMRKGVQEKLSFEMPPTAFNAVAGSSVAVQFPRVGDVRNGNYEITQTQPARWLDDDDQNAGVAFRLPVEMRRISADIWAWDKAEETEVVGATFVPINLALSAPTNLVATVASGRINFSLAVSGSDASDFEWEWRRNGGDWMSGGIISADLVDGLGRINGELLATVAGSYDLRARGIRTGRISTWITTAAPAIIALDLGVPTDGVATGGAARIDLSFVSPNSADFLAMRVFAGPTSDILDAALLTAPVYGSANTLFSFAETGLGASVTRYYFAQSVGPDGAASAFTAEIHATTNP